MDVGLDEPREHVFEAGVTPERTPRSDRVEGALGHDPGYGPGRGSGPGPVESTYENIPVLAGIRWLRA